MRTLLVALALFLVGGSCFVVAGQEIYTTERLPYSIELPSPTWKVLTEADSVREHAEFVNGDRLEGYLQIRREIVDADLAPSDLARRDLDQKLRFLPGFIEGKEEKFAGRLNGVTVSYEFVRSAKPMMGRIYYLQVDNRTIYTLRFTGLRDRLSRIRNQTDLIARSFQLK